MTTRGLVLMAIVALLPGCSTSGPLLRGSPPAALADASEVLVWEGLARPDVLHTIAILLSAVGEGHSDCPRVEQDGVFTMVRGGCTDGSGTEHTGWARRITADGEIRVRLHDFGDAGARITGRTRVSTEGEPRFDLDVRVISETTLEDLAAGASWIAIEAHGRGDAQGRWAAEGRIAAEGWGVVRTQSVGLELDRDRCKTEPAGGRTELWSEGHHVEIRYDGATDCDPENTARWWRDGIEQGELQGIEAPAGCSVGSGGGRWCGGWGGVLMLLVMAGLRRRRAEPDGPLAGCPPIGSSASLRSGSRCASRTSSARTSSGRSLERICSRNSWGCCSGTSSGNGTRPARSSGRERPRPTMAVVMSSSW